MRTEPEHFALHRHHIRGFRHYPFLCVLQAPVAGGRDRIVCPVSTTDELGPTSPRLMIEGRDHVVMLRFMLSLPVLALGEAVGSAQAIRPAIGNALDLLFFGI